MPRSAIAALALIAVVAVRPQAIPQTPSAASILGRVVDGTSDQPIPGTIVRLEPAGKQAPILTGSDGQFLFRQLSPGLYRITASKPGYLDSAYGQMRARGQGTMLLLAENARRDDVVIRMWAWGSITGRVSDEHGRPIVGMNVQAWRHGPNGRLDSVIIQSPLVEGPMPSAVSFVTDSEGRYTINKLSPGRYVLGIVCGSSVLARPEFPFTVAAAGRSQSTPTRSIVIDRGGTSFTATACTTGVTASGERARMYVPTFFGGASSPAAATTIALSAGETVHGIDLTVRSGLSNRVAGTILGTTLGIGLRLVPHDWNASMSLHNSFSLSDGSFVFIAVTPGSYRLTAQPPERFWVDHAITVENDVDGLVVTARPGVKLAGQIQADGTPEGPLGFEVTFNSRRYAIQPNASGTFVINDVVPGTHLFAPKTTTSDWQIVAAMQAGRDVLGTTIDVGFKDMADFVLHFSNRPTSIAGNVIDPRGTSSPDASVVLFPTDPRLWTSARDDSPLFRSVRTWAGHYVLERIPVGEYLLAAVDDAALEEWPDAALLSRIATVGQRIRITTDQQIERDLRVELSIR
jgi:protocatechuate 3,4-dioxygenase beta subunit